MSTPRGPSTPTHRRRSGTPRPRPRACAAPKVTISRCKAAPERGSLLPGAGAVLAPLSWWGGGGPKWRPPHSLGGGRSAGAALWSEMVFADLPAATRKIFLPDFDRLILKRRRHRVVPAV